MFPLSITRSVSANLLSTEALATSRLQIEDGGGCLGKMSRLIKIVMRLMCLILSTLLLLREFGFFLLSYSRDGVGEV